MTPLPRPFRALSRRTSTRLALAALALVPACGDASSRAASPPGELRSAVTAAAAPLPRTPVVNAAAAGPPPAPSPESAEATRVEDGAATPEHVADGSPIDELAGDAPADVIEGEPAPWRGRQPADLRVRIYARSAAEADEGAQSLALRLESLGFAAEVIAPSRWRAERAATWLGDRTLDEVLRGGEAGLVLLPPAATSAGDLLREELGRLYRFAGRGADTRQHEQEGDQVDLLIDVLPRPGMLRKL